MNKPPSNRDMRDLAGRLIAHEAAISKSSKDGGPSAIQVIDKIRLSLTRLAGAAGFRALLVRALAVTKIQAPGIAGIHAIHLTSSGGLDGFSELSDTAETADIGLLLLAQLLDLLVVFIGEKLVLQLLLDVWPNFPLFEEDVRKEVNDGSAR
jgi:hypothetical protein